MGVRLLRPAAAGPPLSRQESTDWLFPGSVRPKSIQPAATTWPPHRGSPHSPLSIDQAWAGRRAAPSLQASGRPAVRTSTVSLFNRPATCQDLPLQDLRAASESSWPAEPIAKSRARRGRWPAQPGQGSSCVPARRGQSPSPPDSDAGPARPKPCPVFHHQQNADVLLPYPSPQPTTGSRPCLLCPQPTSWTGPAPSPSDLYSGRLRPPSPLLPARLSPGVLWPGGGSDGAGSGWTGRARRLRWRAWTETRSSLSTKSTVRAWADSARATAENGRGRGA
jgi:hypothetical protein